MQHTFALCFTLYCIVLVCYPEPWSCRVFKCLPWYALTLMYQHIENAMVCSAAYVPTYEERQLSKGMQSSFAC
jgi:hypothetical protein